MWNPRLPLTLCELYVFLHKTGENILSISEFWWELHDITYDNDQHSVCPAIFIIIVIFIYCDSFKINSWSNLASFKSILKSEAKVNFLKYQVDPTPMHKFI